MKCLLIAFMLGDRFFCLAASERFPLSGREAGIGAFLVAAGRGGRLFERDRPSSRRLIGIESGVLDLYRLPIFSSPPESFHYVFVGRSQSINNG
jgi:hypothetical protein